MNNSLFKDKRGTPVDIVLLPVILVIIAIAAYVSMQGMQDWKNAAYGDLSNQSKAILDQQVNNMGVVDNLFMFFFIGLFLLILAGAILLPSNPIFVVIALFIVIIGVVISAPISNLFQDFKNDSNFNINTTRNASKINFVFENLPLITMALGAITVIVIYVAST